MSICICSLNVLLALCVAIVWGAHYLFRLQNSDSACTVAIPDQSNESIDYYYAGTSTFNLIPFSVSPSECMITYSCTMRIGLVDTPCDY